MNIYFLVTCECLFMFTHEYLFLIGIFILQVINFIIPNDNNESGWLLFNAILATFSALSWREQVNFRWDDDEVRFVIDQKAELDYYSANSLEQQSADRHVAPLWHIILIPSQLVIDQKAELDFYSANSLEQQSADRHVATFRHIILIPSKPVFVLSH